MRFMCNSERIHSLPENGTIDLKRYIFFHIGRILEDEHCKMYKYIYICNYVIKLQH